MICTENLLKVSKRPQDSNGARKSSRKWEGQNMERKKKKGKERENEKKAGWDLHT